TFVHIGRQSELSEHGLSCNRCLGLFVSERNQTDRTTGSQTHDGTGGRAYAPDAGINVAITQSVGCFIEVKALCAEVLLSDAVAFQYRAGVDLCAAARSANRYAFALEIGQRLDVAIRRGDDLDHVRVDGSQRAGV